MPGPSPSPRWPLPRFLEQGHGETVDCPLYDGRGQPVAVVSGTYSLLDADGKAVIDAADVVVSNGVAAYALGATFADAYTLPLDPWRERWVLDAGATYEQEVHVCRVAPTQLVTMEDLFRLHPRWRVQAQKARTSGTYDEPIAVAWEELIRRLLLDGHLPQRTLNWYALADVHKYWAASIVARDFTTDNGQDNRWQAIADGYWKRSQDEYEQRVALQADTDEDGVADNPGQLEPAEPQLFLTSVPTTWYLPGWNGPGSGGPGWWR